MCRDAGDTTSKVSCCVESSLCFKNASFVVIMLLPEGLTHIHSQTKPRLHFGESFTLKDNTHSYCFTLFICDGPSHLL